MACTNIKATSTWPTHHENKTRHSFLERTWVWGQADLGVNPGLLYLSEPQIPHCKLWWVITTFQGFCEDSLKRMPEGHNNSFTSIEHLLRARQFFYITSLKTHKHPMRELLLPSSCLLFIETQRSWVICPRSGSQLATELGFTSRVFGSRTPDLRRYPAQLLSHSCALASPLRLWKKTSPSFSPWESLTQ